MYFPEGLLLTNTSLTTLDLEGNKIDSEGAKLIAEGIQKNKTLTTLILLSSGSFGEELHGQLVGGF